jgi:hypothetical protein
MAARRGESSESGTTRAADRDTQDDHNLGGRLTDDATSKLIAFLTESC